jgi:hypothetical protein
VEEKLSITELREVGDEQEVMRGAEDRVYEHG